MVVYSMHRTCSVFFPGSNMSFLQTNECLALTDGNRNNDDNSDVMKQ